MQPERERRQRELEALEREAERQAAARAELRRQEEASQIAEQNRKDEMMKKILEQSQKTRAEDQARADQIRTQNEENLKEAVASGNQLLDNQRIVNQAEVTKRLTDHQNLMTREQGRLAETEKKIEENVVDMKNKKAEAQEKLHSEKKEYDEKKLQKSEENALKIEDLHKQTAQLEIEKENNAIEHQNRIHGMEKLFKLDKYNIHVAGGKDTRESHFIDAVNNTRSAGGELSNAVVSLGSNAYCLQKGKEAKNVVKHINSCKTSLRRIKEKLNNLKYSARTIRDQDESENVNVAKCHEVALYIQEEASPLEQAIFRFESSLEFDPIENSIELYDEIHRLNASLYKTVNSLPLVSRSYHAITEISRSTARAVLNADNSKLSIQQSETVVVQQSIEDGEMEVDAVVEEIQAIEQ